jgi:hypothetical protein
VSTYILAADEPDVLIVAGSQSQISATIDSSDLVITWGLPYNGGSEILEG